MRRLLDIFCLVIGGASLLAGAALVLLYWLGPAKGMHPAPMVLLAGLAGVFVGAAIFAVARGGRTWPAWAVLIALVTATFALGQTAERWLPHVPTLGLGRSTSPEDTP